MQNKQLYYKRIISDIKKFKKRKLESKQIILTLLGVTKDMYEKPLENLGKESEIEHEIYKDFIRDKSETEYGKKILEKSKEIKLRYAKELNLAAGKLTANEATKTEFTEIMTDHRVILSIQRMIALDSMYEDYKLKDLDLDIALADNEEIPSY